ncbi:MAG: HAMP domain-containing protein [Deltaproteobacteria bacterium]|nr:HAMP domain-containing protein [Deltaproteobacteria bacterium]
METNLGFSQELGRARRVVGGEGELGERVSLEGAQGAWSDNIDAVNELIEDLARPIHETERVINAVAKGNLETRVQLEVDGRAISGDFLRIGNTINTMVDQLGAFAGEVTRVAQEVGTEGKLGGQAVVKGVAGTWRVLTQTVNLMAHNLTSQVRAIAEVTTAVAAGDLDRKITVEADGEILEMKNTINAMVDRLGTFAAEVTRVAREVGVDGKLGGQAEVEGVSGTWKDLTDNVNMLASNLTAQVRNIAEVTTAVAQGDLSRKITVDV